MPHFGCNDIDRRDIYMVSLLNVSSDDTSYFPYNMYGKDMCNRRNCNWIQASLHTDRTLYAREQTLDYPQATCYHNADIEFLQENSQKSKFISNFKQKIIKNKI